MTHKRKIVNKLQFIMKIFQMICLIGLCSSLEGDGNTVETTGLEGSSEKKIFNFETEKQSPAGSPNLKEEEKKKLLGVHADDEYIVQENESEDDNREPEDDGYIVQDDESLSNEDIPHNLEFKKAPKSSNVDTPDEDQVQKTKHDDVIPTGRKDVYHYGNASPQKQEKQSQESAPNNGGQKTKMSTWEKAQLMMMKRNKNKLEKESKQTEASKKDKIDSDLKTTEESLNIEEPDKLHSNNATAGIHNNFVTNDVTDSPSLIDDDDDDDKRVDEDQSEYSMPMADIKKDVNNDKVKNSDDDEYDDDDDESVTDDINDESIEVEEIKIITHNLTDEAMEHIYPDDDDDVKEGGMDHVYPDEEEEEEDNTENEGDEDDDYSNQYDDDDVIIDDSKDVEGATISDNISSVDKSQTDGSDDVTIDAAVGLIDGIGKNQPNDIDVPAEDNNEEPDTVNEGVIDKMTRDDVDANMKDDNVINDCTTADIEQEVKEDDNSVIGAEVQGINVTNEMVIVDSSGKEAIKNDSIVDSSHDAIVDNIENVTVVDGIDNDIVVDGIGNDVVVDGIGNDIVVDGIGNDVVVDGIGNDVVVDGIGNDVVVDGIDNDIAVDDIKKTPDINKYMDNDVDKIERHASEQINEGERATTTVENDSKNISFDLENDVNNFTYIINAGQIDARVIPPTEIMENDGIDADKSAIERFANDTKENVTEESTRGHDVNEEDFVSEIVESIKNKSVDTNVINNKTIYVIGETNVEATLPDVDDQSEMTGTQQELKNDNDVEEEFDNDEISEDNIVEDITVDDGDNDDETIDKSVNPEVSENDNIIDDDEGETNITDKVNGLPVAKDDDNVTRYITNEINHVVDDEHDGDDNKESGDVISPPIVTFEDAPTYVEPTDDDETKDQNDIKEATTDKIVNDDDDIGGDDVGEEENKTETSITDVEIDDGQIFINNSLSDHTILATDPNTDSSRKLDIEQFEVSKIEEPIDETKDVDNNSSQDGEDGKDSIDSLKDTNVERDALNFAEESSKSLEEVSDIKLDVTSQVDENSDADTDGSVHMKPDVVESGEDKEKSNANNENKPEDRMNSGEGEADELESTLDTDQSYEKKEESSTEKKEEALNEKMFDSKDFSIPFEGHGGHPQTMHEDIGKKDESIDDLARELTHHDKEEVQTECDDKDATIKGHADKVEGEAKEGEKTPGDESIKENDDTADEGITRDDEKLLDNELEQIFHDATPKTASSFWKFITIKPYVALLRTLTDKLDPHITNIIFMLPPSVQSIFLKAPFGMYPTNAFFLLLFFFFSLFVLQTSRKSQIDSQNKSRILRELLFEKRGEVLLRQTEKDEADERLKEAREELKQKETDFENGIANHDKNLKAIAKEHNSLKDEILKKIEKCNEMEEDCKKIESDIVKQSCENKELQESVSSTKELIQKLQDMRDDLQRSIDESDLKCLKLEESIDCLNNDVCTIKESYDQLSTVVEAKKKESGELQDVVEALNVKCTKQSSDLQRKEQANKALRNAILKLKMIQLLLKANGCQATDDDAHNDGAADDDDNGDDDDQKKQEKIDEKIKHLVYIAQMKSRMDEMEKERMSLRKDLSKEIDVRMKLNDDLDGTAEEMKRYEQLKEDAEQRASNLNIRIEVQEKYLKEKEKELNRILMEMKAKENAKSKQKKSAEEKYKEVEKMVAENRKLVEQWEAEKEKMAIDYEKQIAQQERKVQEYVAFANRAKRDFEEKEKLSKTLREKLLLYQDIINKCESMLSMQRSSESLNASQNLDVRSSSRNLLTRDNAHPSMSPIPPPPIPPPHIASEFFGRFAPPPRIPPSLLFSERSMPPPFLMRPRESSPISDNFRDVLPSDDRYRFHPTRSTPPMRFGPTYRSPPPANRERYPNANNRPQYMGKGDGSHRTSKD